MVAVIFTIIFTLYLYRMEFPDWRPLPEPPLLWVNTGILFLASVALQWARVSVRAGRLHGAKTPFMAGGVFTWLFLAGQLWAWRELYQLGYVVEDNPSNSFFYLITTLHGLHLLGGLGAWAIAAVRLWKKVNVGLSIQLCAVYWHVLLLVWLMMFGLMLST